MELYEIPLRPLSGFGTPLKGDTLFGHFCWQTVHNPELLNGGFEKHIRAYAEKPFAVFSSAFPRLSASEQYVLKKPDIPAFMFSQEAEECCETRQKQVKALKKKKWISAECREELPLLRPGKLREADLLTDKELVEKIACQVPLKVRLKRQKHGAERFTRHFLQPHNTINRRTGTTGTDMFAPYVHQNTFFYPETELVLFVLIDTEATDAQRVRQGLANIGKWGYGRDASTGMGRFSVGDPKRLKLPDMKAADAIYMLAPCVPEEKSFSCAWFTPFIRFGKHGDEWATSDNPFKVPVIMADEGAVFRFEEGNFPQKPYFGRAVTGVSRHEGTVVQGYAPFLPVKTEEGYE